MFLSIDAWETKNPDIFSVAFALYFYHPIESYLKLFKSHFGTHLDLLDSKWRQNSKYLAKRCLKKIRKKQGFWSLMQRYLKPLLILFIELTNVTFAFFWQLPLRVAPAAFQESQKTISQSALISIWLRPFSNLPTNEFSSTLLPDHIAVFYKFWLKNSEIFLN